MRLSVALARRAAGAVPQGESRSVEDALASLVVGADPLALAELSRRRLAPFEGQTERSRERLLDTLGAWLAHHGDRQAVAAELGIHPQTVRYRVGLLRELLGDDLDDPQRRFELALVLHPRPPGGPSGYTGEAPDQLRQLAAHRPQLLAPSAAPRRRPPLADRAACTTPPVRPAI